MIKWQPNHGLACGPTGRSLESSNILLVEDSPGEAELFCQALVLAWDMLEPLQGFPRPEIEVRCTAEDALEALKQCVTSVARDLPELLVLDLDLPAGTGLTFLRALRTDPRLMRLPIIAMLWSEDEAFVRTLAGLGVAGYVLKPLRFADLVTVVGELCRKILARSRPQDLTAAAEADRHDELHQRRGSDAGIRGLI